MGYTNFKQNHIELYSQIAPNRLTTGLLSVNIVHKDNASETEGDWKKSYDDTGNSSTSSGGRIPTNQCMHNPIDPATDSEADNQRIGDYSCHLFYVVVGCTWNQPREPIWENFYEPPNAPAPGSPNQWVSPTTFNENRPHPDHCNCQSFIRAYPIGLINPDTGSLVNHQTFTVDGLHGVIRSKLGNAKNSGTPWVEDDNNISFADSWNWGEIAAQFGAHNGLGSPYKQPTGSKLKTETNSGNGQEIHNYNFNQPTYDTPSDGQYPNIENPHTGPFSGFPDLAFNRRRPRSFGNNTGLLPNYGNGYVSSEYTHISTNDSDGNETAGSWDDTSSGGGSATNINQNKLADMDLTEDIDKSYKNPVRSITIEGWHDFNYRDAYTGASATPGDTFGKYYWNGTDLIAPTGAFTITRHTPFAIRVGIDLNSDGWEMINHPISDDAMGPGVQGPTAKKLGDSTPTNNPYEQTYGLGARKVSVNVSFNPFGETNVLNFTASPPEKNSDDGT